MAEKRTKADKQERQTEQLGKKVDRRPDQIEKKPSIEQQIQQRAYKLYEQRGRTDGHDLEDWLQAEREISGKQANEPAA